MLHVKRGKIRKSFCRVFLNRTSIIIFWLPFNNFLLEKLHNIGGSWIKILNRHGIISRLT